MAMTTERWSRILKVAARGFAVLLLVQGALLMIVFGILGVGPDGAVPQGGRLPSLVLGLLNLAWAVLYWLPNERIEPYRRPYLAATLYLPLAGSLAIMGVLIYTFATDSAFREVAAAYFASYLAVTMLALAAPVSFLLHMKAKRPPSL
jgi:hypothetical protein